MQYIAEDPVHVVVRNDIPALHDTSGRMVAPARRRLFAKFKRGTAPGWAIEIAKSAGLEFRAMPQNVSTEQWVSFYDSVEDAVQMGWTAEELAAIDEKLAGMHSVIVVSKPPLPAPWPGYDQLVAEGRTKAKRAQVAAQIAQIVELTGYDPVEVEAYERENLNRPEVLEALGAASDGAPAAEDADDDGEVIDG